MSFGFGFNPPNVSPFSSSNNNNVSDNNNNRSSPFPSGFSFGNPSSAGVRQQNNTTISSDSQQNNSPAFDEKSNKTSFFTFGSSSSSSTFPPPSDPFPKIHDEIESLTKLIRSAESSTKANNEELQKLRKENEALKEEIEMSKSALSKSKLLPEDLEIATLNTLRQVKMNLIESQKLVLEREMELIESDHFCSCCLASKKNVVFLPCCHLCTCEKCSFKLTACPLCRKNIEKKIVTHN
ncbi:hypothetical protein FDP41_004387 [Naegleria fowleri]|uniref:RING-type domain-containing protein n=1 Tax=Naegleria fowleri TaxID=5763 RepID=A0A6A5BQI4_NAEFO|nr:uncharacterized protein FDP41_004387 [Naegleria fowleri]KAF0976488.1 hypothetical protein FDP41_004387 [Naegleria fowleri]CAG4715793.1 unnamed protein product [Naegleria fowleri]